MEWKFWKKHDDPLNDPFADLSSGFSAPETSIPSPQPSMTPPAFTPESHPSNVAFTPVDAHAGEKSLHFDLVLARLDSIRSQLDVINQRLATIEANMPSPTMRRTENKGPWYRN